MKENLNPVKEDMSTKHSTHLEVANLLAKGFPHVQVGNGVVQDGLHDPVERTKILSPRCQLGWQSASVKRLGGQEGTAQ